MLLVEQTNPIEAAEFQKLYKMYQAHMNWKKAAEGGGQAGRQQQSSFKYRITANDLTRLVSEDVTLRGGVLDTKARLGLRNKVMAYDGSVDLNTYQ